MNLAGQTFGRLTVVRSCGWRDFLSGQRVRLWRCQCECGNRKTIFQSHLRSGHTQSCGCLDVETATAHIVKANTKHGHACAGKKTKEWRAWSHMKDRCFNPKAKDFKYYGGRGITVCKRWRTSFAKFLKDMQRAPGLNYSIDRKNVNGNYTPKNCRWATRKQQTANRRCSA